MDTISSLMIKVDENLMLAQKYQADSYTAFEQNRKLRAEIRNLKCKLADAENLLKTASK